jgi:hypothetical protein
MSMQVAAASDASVKASAAALPSTTAAAAAAAAVASTKAAVAAAVNDESGSLKATVSSKAASVKELPQAPVVVRAQHPHILDCAPFPDTDTQQLIFAFIGEKQRLVMGAVCRQWQYMYKEYVTASYMEPDWQPEKWKHGHSIAYDEYCDTAYSAVFASLPLLLMGVSGRTLDLHATRAQHNAGRHGSEAVLLAAHKRGMPWSPAMLKGAAVSGCVSKMQWLLGQHKWRVMTGAADCAAASGSLDMLKLLKQHKAGFTAKTSLRAVKAGHLQVFKYLHSQGCPTNWYTAYAAAECGALDTLQFLYDTGHDIRSCWVIGGACRKDNLQVVVWLAEHGAELDDSVMCSAAVFGSLEMCKYLMERGCEWTSDLTDLTIDCRPEIMPWVLSQGITLTAEQQVKLEQRM